MSFLEIKDLKKIYDIEGMSVRALDGIDIDVEEGEFIVIVGRSGSGKTTLLRILAGLESQTGGEILHNGRQIDEENLLPVSMVFQEARLLPWLSVENNILFPFLAQNKVAEKRTRARELLKMLGLEDYGGAIPSQLSGGMAQRVALGRALINDPEIILLDEPMGALDYFTRRTLQQELVKIYLEGKKTFLMVTHDVGEALLMGTRIIVFNEGRIKISLDAPIEYPRRRSNPEFQRLSEVILSSIEGRGG